MATKRQQELLANIANREKSVRRKIRRLENKGVRITGTDYDPRQADVGNMTARQMGSYLRKLDTFTDRKTQFVPGASGKPLPAAKWRKFKQVEKAGNDYSLRYRAKIDNVYNPHKGMTMGEYRAMKRGDLPSRLVPSVNDPFDVRSRSSYGVTNEKALDKLIKEEQKRTTPQNFKKWQKSNREAAKKMLTDLHEEELLKKLNKLTDEQFHLLWESGASEVALAYVVAKSAFESNEDEPPWWAERSGDEMGEVRDLAQWASTVDTDDAAKVSRPGRKSNTRKRAQYTDTRAQAIDTISQNQSPDTWAGPIKLPRKRKGK
jgi:hypothetical protein